MFNPLWAWGKQGIDLLAHFYPFAGVVVEKFVQFEWEFHCDPASCFADATVEFSIDEIGDAPKGDAEGGDDGEPIHDIKGREFVASRVDEGGDGYRYNTTV